MTDVEHEHARLAKRALFAVQCALNACTNCMSRSQVEAIVTASGYAEPGYADPRTGIVVLGNWNEADGDKTPERLCALLERLGVSAEWSDEWAICEECDRAVRTQPDSYSWRASFAVLHDCEIVCHKCMEKSRMPDYLRSLEGQADRALTFDVDLVEYGYLPAGAAFESGFHPGQDASPAEILRVLNDAGIYRALFRITDAGQFDMRFTCHVHETEYTGITPAVRSALARIAHTEQKVMHA